MKRHLFLTYVFVLLFPLSLSAQDYSAAVANLDKSVLRMEMAKAEGKGVCSSVVYEIVDGTAYALTAAHCVAHGPNDAFDMTIAERTGKVVLSNTILDLAVVSFRPGREIATIVLAPITPPPGTPTIAAGYAFGVEDIVFQFGYVAQTRNHETKAVWLNMDIIFGDSGGAILDTQGRLIGITSSIFSQGAAHIGGAVRIEQVHDFLDAARDQIEKDEKKKK